MHIFMHTFHYLMFLLWHCKLHMQFWQGGAQLWRSPLQHPPVRFARGKLRLVGEVFPFDSEFTARGSLTQMQSGTPSKSAKGDFFRGLLFTFWKTCVWGRWNVYIASWRLFQIAHIYMHKAVKGLSNKSFDNFLLCAKTFRKFLHLIQLFLRQLLTLWPLYHLLSKWLSNTLCIYICTVPRRLSAHYAYIYAHFSLFDVFTVALQVTHAVLAGGCPTSAESPAASVSPISSR